MKKLLKWEHKQYVIFIYLSLILLSCGETLKVDTPDFIEGLVVESYVINNANNIFLKLSKTMSPYESSNYDDTTLQVHDAKIKIILDNKEYLMTEDTTRYGSYNYNNYTYTYRLQKRAGEYYLRGVDLSNISTCNLKIDHKDNHVSSDVEFPGVTKIKSAGAAITKKIPSGSSYPLTYLQLNISADFPRDIKSYYQVSYVCNYINPSTKNPWVIAETGYFIHSSNDTTIFFEMKLHYGNMGYTTENPRIYLEHISKNYYDFVKAMETQEENDGSIFGTEGTQIPTNIKNGFGIFTCISRDTICLDIK